MVSNPSETTSLPHADFQVWPELDLQSKLGRRVDVTLESQGRFSFNLPDPEVYVLGAYISVSAAKYLTLTPSYYYYGFAKMANAVGYGHNVILAAEIKATYRAFTLEERNRFVGVFSESQKFWVTETVLRFNVQ